MEDEPMVLSDAQRKAIQVHLRQHMGAELYDRVFLQAKYGEIDDGVFHVFAGSEDLADEMNEKFSHYLAKAAREVTGMPVDFVMILPDD